MRRMLSVSLSAMSVDTMGPKTADVSYLYDFYSLRLHFQFLVYGFTLVKHREPNCTVTDPIKDWYGQFNLNDQYLIDHKNCNFTCISD
jgi:hypothetical protein